MSRTPSAVVSKGTPVQTQTLVAPAAAPAQAARPAVGHISNIVTHSPSPFRQKQINGVTYNLNHLCSFEFDIQTTSGKKRVFVEFSCHCFTEELTAGHSPALHYTHNNEKRAFCVNRHALSQQLSNIITTIGNRSVYNTKKGTFFLLRSGLPNAGSAPYLVFFSAIKSTKTGVDILVNVESAYPKPNMTQRAAPVKFTTIVEATALGKKVPVGPPQTIKRK